MNILKPFTGLFDKLTKDKIETKGEKILDLVGEIKATYFYSLTNTGEKDIELFWNEQHSFKIEKEHTEVYRGASLDALKGKGSQGKELRSKELIQELADSNQISFSHLEIEQYTNYMISNRTAQNIEITNYNKKDKLIIPPFGTRLMNSEILRWYNFLDLRDQDQIQVERIDQAYKFQDWITLRPFLDSFKKLTARESDVIGSIKDNYYYRLYNKTEDNIELALPPPRDGSENKPYILPKFSNTLKTQVFTGVFLNAVGKKKILELVNSNLVNFQPLEIKADANYIISNRTEQRIGIMNYNGKDQLIIPPLGTRLINSDKLKWYNFLEWYWQDLIRVEPEDQAFISAESFFRIWDWVKLLPGVALVGLAGFGIPLWIVYNFGDGRDLLNSFILSLGQNGQTLSDQDALNILGRIFQVGFICIASILPALFYSGLSLMRAGEPEFEA